MGRLRPPDDSGMAQGMGCGQAADAVILSLPVAEVYWGEQHGQGPGRRTDGRLPSRRSLAHGTRP